MDRSRAPSQIPADETKPPRPRDRPGTTVPDILPGQPDLAMRHRTVPAGDARSSWARPPDITEELQRAREGDQEAFRVLYRDANPRVLRYLQAMVGADAEDVASETWLQIARDLHTFRGDSDGFRGWVATIARHRATDHLRRARRRPQSMRMTPEEFDSWAAGDDTEGTALERVATDSAIALIAQLPGDQAEAVLLRVVMGLDAATAGKVLGKRPGAVRTASYRGLRRLSAWLAQQERNGDSQFSAWPGDQPGRRGGGWE